MDSKRQKAAKPQSDHKPKSTMQSLPPITSGAGAACNLAESQRDGGEETKTLEKKKRARKAKMPKLIFNLYYTVYPIIKQVAKELGFRVRTDDIMLVPPAPGSEEYYLR